MFESDVIPSIEIKEWLEMKGYKPVYLSLTGENPPNTMYLVTQYNANSDEEIEYADVQIYHRNVDYIRGYVNMNVIKKLLLADTNIGNKLTIKSGVIPLTKKDKNYYEFTLNVMLYKEVIN